MRSLSVVDPGFRRHEGSEQRLHPALPAPERGVVRLRDHGAFVPQELMKLLSSSYQYGFLQNKEQRDW